MKVGVGVAGVVEQGLPLADHAEGMVVDDRNLDRDVVEHTGDQLLIGHLEAAIPVNAPHDGVGLSNLGPHRRGDAEPHGSRATGAEPFHRLFMRQEVSGPHLMLSHTRDIDRVGRAQLPNASDDLLG